jgi:hypothetical protein
MAATFKGSFEVTIKGNKATIDLERTPEDNVAMVVM